MRRRSCQSSLSAITRAQHRIVTDAAPARSSTAVQASVVAPLV